MKQTIAHIITGLNTGGAEIMLERLLERHEQSQFRPIVICLTRPGPIAERIRALGVPIFALDMSSGIPNPLAIRSIRMILKREKAVVAQTWLYHADLLGGLAAKSARIPVAWGVHRSSLDRANTKRSILLIAQGCRLVSRFVPACIVCCAESSLRFHADFGYPARKLHEIPNGFDLDVFTPNPVARTRIRTELNIRDDHILIGIVGRFMTVKNHRLFVEAAALAASRNARLRFVMVGDGLSTDNPDLVAWIRATPDPARFQLLGRRADTSALLAGMDVLALSSDTEAFPLVIGEAMATGRPCIATDAGDSARLIADTGAVVPRGDHVAMADAMINMASLDRAARDELGSQARQRIAREFDINVVSARYEALWRQLAAGEKPCV